MPSAAAGWALAYRTQPGTLDVCDRCGQKTSALYRRRDDFELRNFVCGICMDERADVPAPTAKDAR